MEVVQEEFFALALLPLLYTSAARAAFLATQGKLGHFDQHYRFHKCSFWKPQLRYGLSVQNQPIYGNDRQSNSG